jgi:hypothetical protein
VVLYFGASTGFAPPVSVTSPSLGLGRYGSLVARAGDLNGDGYQDLAIADSGARNLFVLFGHPTMVGPQELALEGDLPTGSRVVCAGDLDGDRRDELLIAAPMGGLIAVRRLTSGFVRTSLGDASSAWDSFGLGVAGAGDLNGDGRDDLVVGTAAGLAVFPGTPTTLVGPRLALFADRAFPNLGRTLALGR